MACLTLLHSEVIFECKYVCGAESHCHGAPVTMTAASPETLAHAVSPATAPAGSSIWSICASTGNQDTYSYLDEAISPLGPADIVRRV